MSNDIDLSQYSIHYKGCQSITQWVKNDANYDGRSPVQPKYVAQYRLCPADKCSSSGCSSKQYGDYLIDMQSFVTYLLKEKGYVSAVSSNNGNNNNQYAKYYEEEEEDQGDDSASNSVTEIAYSPIDYVKCGLYNGTFSSASSNTNTTFSGYIGATCSSTSQSIEFNIFSDSTCKTKMSNGLTKYKSATSSNLPFSSSSPLISPEGGCISCGGDYSSSSLCSSLYQVSGKCEEKMYDMEYPNESACDYISSLEVMRREEQYSATGSASSAYFLPSIGATVAIEVLFVLSIGLGTYVMFLKQKLSRAKTSLRFS